MPKQSPADLAFEITFFESVLRRDRRATEVIELLGALYTRAGRMPEGLQMDRRLVRLQPANPTAHYNLACSLALVKRKRDALRTLHRAVKLGYRDFHWMTHDPDLETLQSLPEFAQLLDLLKPSS